MQQHMPSALKLFAYMFLYGAQTMVIFFIAECFMEHYCGRKGKNEKYYVK